MAKMRRIGVLTSGGDGPGLNPCIRAVTRTAIGNGVEVMGIRRGYTGLINGEFESFTARSVGGILGKGGTFLGTTRLPAFKELPTQRQAVRMLNQASVDGLVVIGGYSRVLGDAADTPFTDIRGSKNQFLGAVGIGYTF